MRRLSHLFSAHFAEIADARLSRYAAPWNLVFPILAIFLAVLGFNLLGDGLRRTLDVRLVEGR